MKKTKERQLIEKAIDNLNEAQFRNFVRWILDLEPIVEKGSIKDKSKVA